MLSWRFSADTREICILFIFILSSLLVFTLLSVLFTRFSFLSRSRRTKVISRWSWFDVYSADVRFIFAFPLFLLFTEFYSPFSVQFCSFPFLSRVVAPRVSLSPLEADLIFIQLILDYICFLFFSLHLFRLPFLCLVRSFSFLSRVNSVCLWCCFDVDAACILDIFV